MEKENLKLRDLHENETLNIKELMEIHGGIDEDNDCTILGCITNRNSDSCLIAKCYLSS